MAWTKPLKCDELSEALALLAIDYAKAGRVPLNAALENVRSHFPDFKENITRELLVDSINAYQATRKKSKQSQAQKDRAKLIQEAKSDRLARELLDRLDKALRSVPHEPMARKERKQAVKAIRELREIQREVAKLVAAKERIIEVERKKATGDLSTKTKKVQGPKQELLARRDALNKELAQLRGDDKRRQTIQSEIEKIGRELESGQFEDRTKRETRERPADIQRAQKQLDELRKERRKAVGPDIEARNARLDSQIAELERRIREKDFPDRPDPVQGPKEEIVAQRDRLRRIANLVEQNIELTRQLASGRLEDTTRKTPTELDKEVDRLMFERERLRAQIRQEIRNARPMTLREKMMEPFNVARTVLTSFDVSALLRQGGFIVFGHPIKGAKALGVGLKSLFVPGYASKINREITTGDRAYDYDRAKLHLSDIEGSLSAQEEAVATTLVQRLAGKNVTLKNFLATIPAKLVQHTQKVYTVILNKLRADMFDTMERSLTRKQGATQEELEAIANYINVATGRGSLGKKGNQALEVANALFFAPRYVASRFQMLGLQPLYSGSARTRKAVAMEYARYLIGLASVIGLGLLAGGELGDDETSPDFMKLKWGNTRVDMASGFLQPLVFMARLNPFGDYEGDRGAVIGRFIRSKLSPLASTFVDAFSKENYIGENTDPTTAEGRERLLTRLFIPLSFGETIESMEEHGLAKGTAFGILSMLGAGVQTYEKKKPPPKKIKF